jgi:hypothetical protein
MDLLFLENICPWEVSSPNSSKINSIYLEKCPEVF